MTAYTANLTITANSAIDTAAICYRKARRDVRRIHGLLTHPRTVEAAKIAVWCLYLGAIVAFTLGQTARILVDTGAKVIQRWAEAEVASCLPTEPNHIPDAGKMVDDPFAPDENPAYATVPAAMAPAATLVVKAEPATQTVTTAHGKTPACAAVVATQPKEPTIRELKRMASEARIKGYGTMSKARLMEALALA